MDLGNSYKVTYYPQPNPNEGFRKISVEITSDVVEASFCCSTVVELVPQR